MIIIDVGGCVGKFTDSCVQKYGEKIEKIFIFEPHGENFKFLKRKYALEEKIKVYNIAISCVDANVVFNQQVNEDTKKTWVGDGGSSMNPEFINEFVSFDSVIGSNIVKPKAVRSMRLSRFIRLNPAISHIDILKIDVEGSEYDILSDIIHSGVYKMIDKIYFEDHCEDIHDLRYDMARFIDSIRSLSIENKFYIQSEGSGLDEYTPLKKIMDNNRVRRIKDNHFSGKLFFIWVFDSKSKSYGVNVKQTGIAKMNNHCDVTSLMLEKIKETIKRNKKITLTAHPLGNEKFCIGSIKFNLDVIMGDCIDLDVKKDISMQVPEFVSTVLDDNKMEEILRLLRNEMHRNLLEKNVYIP